MAGTGPTDLHDQLAIEFLDACTQALDTIPSFDPTLTGAPSRAFVSHASPVLDCCDQLTVHVAGLSQGDSAPLPPSASDARINRVTLTTTITRCVPVMSDTGVLPTPEEQEASAAQVNADKWALWNHIYNMINAHLLFDKCCEIIWSQIRPINTSGGCGGSTFTITVCFDGYQEVFGT